MKIVQMILTLSIASMLVVAPVELVQAVDAHHPAQGSATKKAPPIAKKKIKASKKYQAVKPKQSGQMSMGSMMMNCPKMQSGQAGHGNMMQCPMMSTSNSVVTPFHSLRMQWHHNMMMWHHNMIHSQSSKLQGS